MDILINRMGSTGDVFVAAAVCPALKKKYPDCRIYFATECHHSLHGNPFVDFIIKPDPQRQFDLVINLDAAYEARQSENFLKCYADKAGVPVEDCELFVKNDPVNKPEVVNYVVVHAGVSEGWVGRAWGKNEWRELALRLYNAGYQIVCVGGEGDHFVPSHVDVRNKTTVGELATIIKDAKAFVGVDSFPFHVAQAVETPAVVFFGSVAPNTRVFNSNVVPVTAKELPCLGCHSRKTGLTYCTDVCETGDQACISRVSVDDMWKALLLVLNQSDAEAGQVKTTRINLN
jgi:ADP-heptose:LPS heptosyltransferase